MVIIVVGIVTGVLSIDITSDKNQRLYIGHSTISKRVFLMSWIRFILMLELERLSSPVSTTLLLVFGYVKVWKISLRIFESSLLISLFPFSVSLGGSYAILYSCMT